MKIALILLMNLTLLLSGVAQQKDSDTSTRDIPNKNYQTLTELISVQWKLDRIADADQKNNSANNLNRIKTFLSRSLQRSCTGA